MGMLITLYSSIFFLIKWRRVCKTTRTLLRRSKQLTYFFFNTENWNRVFSLEVQARAWTRHHEWSSATFWGTPFCHWDFPHRIFHLYMPEKCRAQRMWLRDVISWKGTSLTFLTNSLFFVGFFFFFFDNSFIYLLLAGLGLHHFPWTFSRCSRQGLLSRCGVEASHMVASNCGTRALGHAGCSSCSPQARSLQHMGLVTLRHVGSSQTRDWTHVPCNGRPILNHWATREALSNSYP